MRILLTGSTGFVGHHLLEYLSTNTKHEIITTVGDLTKPLDNLGYFDYIINLASKSSVEQSVQNPSQFVTDNVAMATNVLEYARTHRPQVFLHFSTVEVYNVTNPYAASKAAQEAIANAYWKTYDLPIIIARSSNIIGPGQRPDKFVPKVIKQVTKGDKVKIYTANGKQGSRLYNPIENILSAIKFMLDVYPDLESYDADFPIHYDIGGGQKVNNLTMAQMIAERLGKPLDYELYEPVSSRPNYAPQLVTSGHSLEDYGWRPPLTLTEGLKWIH